jgi:hypothetical protein
MAGVKSIAVEFLKDMMISSKECFPGCDDIINRKPRLLLVAKRKNMFFFALIPVLYGRALSLPVMAAV